MTALLDVSWTAGRPTEDDEEGQWSVMAPVSILEFEAGTPPEYIGNDPTVEIRHPVWGDVLTFGLEELLVACRAAGMLETA